MKRNYSLDEKMMTIHIGIVNASREDVLRPYLDSVGYTTEKIAEGKALLDEANTFIDEQKLKYFEKYMSTDEVERMKKEVAKLFMIHSKMARTFFKDSFPVFKSLGLLDKSKDALSTWVRKAQKFYSLILNTEFMVNRFVAHNVTREQLQGVMDMIMIILNSKTIQGKWKSVAQQLTQDRNGRLEKLFDWYRQFLRFAEVGLEEKPQLLEMLGKRVKS